MHLIRFTGVFVLAVILNFTAAGAITLREATGPANLPPPGFQGRQFVDNNGCIFVRAGSGDGVTWVPRVTRRRQVICGQQPTFARQSQVAAPATTPAIPPARTTPANPRPQPAVSAAILVPDGYRRVWTDGRLNPNRGPRTARGDVQSARVWTNTVPRRLLLRRQR